jgi:hypothetical protein
VTIAVRTPDVRRALAAHLANPSEATLLAVRAAVDASASQLLQRADGRLAWAALFDPQAQSLVTQGARP